MQISRTSVYAIGAMLQLADSPPRSPIPCSQLAKTGEMPGRFLLQVLRNLVNHGLLKSSRGANGGYSLSRDANQISLLQILEVTEGPLVPGLPPLECIPRTVQSLLQSTMQQISADTCQRLAGVLLVDLIAPAVNEDGLSATWL